MAVRNQNGAERGQRSDGAQRKNSAAKGIVLTRPSLEKPVEVLYEDLSRARKKGRLGSQSCAQDALELAVRLGLESDASESGAQHAAKKFEDSRGPVLDIYVGLLLDILEQYRDSSMLCLWSVEALVCLQTAAGDTKGQLALPIFDAIVGAAIHLACDPDVELHERFLAALAKIMSPFCQVEDKLVDYVLQQLSRREGRWRPLLAEHALALLGMARQKHRLRKQIDNVLLVLRGYTAEARLATRALMTAVSLYELAEELASAQAEAEEHEEDDTALLWDECSDATKAKEQEQVVAADDKWFSGFYATTDAICAAGSDAYTAAGDAVAVAGGTLGHMANMTAQERKTVYELGVPRDSSDVRLVSNLLALHLGSRKVAGAALAALAVMARLSEAKLNIVVVDELRGLVVAQQRHPGSLAVNLHAAEIIRMAASSQDPSIVGDAAVLVVSRAMRSFPRKAEVVACSAEALRLFTLSRRRPNLPLEVVPATELVAIGEAHAQDPRVAKSICELMTTQASTKLVTRDALVDAGAVAVPFRALQAKYAYSKEAGLEAVVQAMAAAARTVACLVFHSPKALWHVARLDGTKILFAALRIHRDDPRVVGGVLLALSCVCKEPKVRNQVADPQALLAVLHAAERTAHRDPDILAQACSALGAITASEDHEEMVALRRSIDWRRLRDLVSTTQERYPDLSEDFCTKLMAVAVDDWHRGRLLTETGAEVKPYELHDLPTQQAEPVAGCELTPEEEDALGAISGSGQSEGFCGGIGGELEPEEGAQPWPAVIGQAAVPHVTFKGQRQQEEDDIDEGWPSFWETSAAEEKMAADRYEKAKKQRRPVGVSLMDWMAAKKPVMVDAGVQCDASTEAPEDNESDDSRGASAELPWEQEGAFGGGSPIGGGSPMPWETPSGADEDIILSGALADEMPWDTPKAGKTKKAGTSKFPSGPGPSELDGQWLPTMLRQSELSSEEEDPHGQLADLELVPREERRKKMQSVTSINRETGDDEPKARGSIKEEMGDEEGMAGRSAWEAARIKAGWLNWFQESDRDEGEGRDRSKAALTGWLENEDQEGDAEEGKLDDEEAGWKNWGGLVGPDSDEDMGRQRNKGGGEGKKTDTETEQYHQDATTKANGGDGGAGFLPSWMAEEADSDRVDEQQSDEANGKCPGKVDEGAGWMSWMGQGMGWDADTKEEGIKGVSNKDNADEANAGGGWMGWIGKGVAAADDVPHVARGHATQAQTAGEDDGGAGWMSFMGVGVSGEYTGNADKDEQASQKRLSTGGWVGWFGVDGQERNEDEQGRQSTNQKPRRSRTRGSTAGGWNVMPGFLGGAGSVKSEEGD